MTNSTEFGLTFFIVSGEKWGVVAQNVTRNLNSHESGSENALFRDLRAFDGREEARCRTCALADKGRRGNFSYYSASCGRLSDGDAGRGIRPLGATNSGVASTSRGEADGYSKVLQRGPHRDDRQAGANSSQREALRPRSDFPAKWCSPGGAAASRSGAGNATQPWKPATPRPTNASQIPSACDSCRHANLKEMNKPL